MSELSIVLVLAGAVLLAGGAEMLVRGSARLAVGFGISPVIVGLTVVSFATSSPEIAVGVESVYANEGDLAIGNVIGSNILNVLLILGLSALVVPLSVAQRLIRIDVPLMIILSLAVLVLSRDGSLARWEGVVFLTGLLAYVGFTILQSRQGDETPEVESEYESEYARRGASASTVVINLGMIGAGLAILVLGSRWLVSGATEIALSVGLSELIIGLTIVAIGTSLPEIATSILAAVKGERDIAVGNVIGSNIFNLLGVLGLLSLVTPDQLAFSDAARRFDIPVMCAVALATLPIFVGGTISRLEGALFLAYYLGYLGYIILDASSHDRLGAYSTAMLFFVIPLTVVVVLVTAYYEVRNRGLSGKVAPGGD